ncbi:hypothetical protein [Altericroceibacterium endophyticum]|uniref:Uncharacterized protein n=1 Tax=Altericroceibacterium endophyticum TaxID=1808508 RepID=A0A6I4T896_9SPHN|nr:hypothetical protein [Altericroceibacterium endophyticum]MXO66233.1 hypothetical protein [Altericroceibacterium endophyticum]
MSDNNDGKKTERKNSDRQFLTDAHVPLQKLWQPATKVQGGYRPPTSEGGTPPTGGGGGKEPNTDKKE